MLTYHLYTIFQLLEWLLQNVGNGITDSMIAHQRAWALLNNPCAKNDDLVISAVLANDRVIGYTAIFAEDLKKPFAGHRFYWGSSQWVEPEYRGKGISAKMMLIMKEAINHRYLGLDSSIASCKLDQKQGYKIVYYPRYFFQWKTTKSTLFSLIKERYVQCMNRNIIRQLLQYDYTNRYIPTIDGKTYDFICSHSQGDLFLRSQEMLNWVLHYPFLCAIENDAHAEKEKCEFGSYVDEFEMNAIQVYVENQLRGVYIYSIVDGIFKVLYLYYDEQYSEQVFASLVVKALQRNVMQFRTFNRALYDYMNRKGIRNINSKYTIDQISLTLPPDIEIDQSLSIQGGDGDMFC